MILSGKLKFDSWCGRSRPYTYTLPHMCTKGNNLCTIKWLRYARYVHFIYKKRMFTLKIKPILLVTDAYTALVLESSRFFSLNK